MVVDQVDDDVAALLHRLRHNTDTRTGLVVATLGSGSLQRVIECGVAAVFGAPKPTRTNSWAWCWR
ncbi:hypothetical protein SGLAM104S_10454 [Streptomyces glaucescens]